MKRLSISAILAAAVFGMSACANDPTASLRTGPHLLSVSPRVLFMSEDSTASLLAIPRDEELNPIALPVTAASGNQAVATVQPDADRPSPDTSFTAFVVTAVSPGQTTITLTAGGLTATTTVNVLPLAFGGTPSATTLDVGDTLILSSTPVLKFDPGASDIDFGEGHGGWLVSRTADELRIIVPVVSVGQPAPLTVDEVSITYVTGLTTSLPTTSEFTITNPFDPNGSCAQAAPVAVPSVFYEGFSGGEADNFYRLTLAAPTTFTVTLAWPSDADLDILYRNAACTGFVGNFDGATVSNPEVSTVTLAAGTYNLWINNFVSSGAPPAAPIYRVTITSP